MDLQLPNKIIQNSLLNLKNSVCKSKDLIKMMMLKKNNFNSYFNHLDQFMKSVWQDNMMVVLNISNNWIPSNKKLKKSNYRLFWAREMFKI